MSDIKYYSTLVKVHSLDVDPPIRPGDLYIGYFKSWPELGKCFMFNSFENELKLGGVDAVFKMPGGLNYPLTTTVVTELIDNRTFRTKNSIYKITLKADILDEKINKILS